MNTVTVAEAKENLEHLVAQVIASAEPVLMSPATGQQVALVPLSDVSAWRETLYLLSDPANEAHLQRSIAEAQVGKIAERELLLV